MERVNVQLKKQEQQQQRQHYPVLMPPLPFNVKHVDMVMMVMRSSERIDRCWPDYIETLATNDTQMLLAHDANFPINLRPRPIAEWYNDTDITVLGQMQSKIIGDCIRRYRLSLTAVYTSPALRCLSTARSLIGGAINEKQFVPKIRIEPALSECLQHYKGEMPRYISKDELNMQQFPIDGNYEPMLTIGQLKSCIGKESYAASYERITTAISHIFEHHRNSGGISSNGPKLIVIVAHAQTVDAFARYLHKIKFDHISSEKWKLLGTFYPPSCAITGVLHANYCCTSVKEKKDNERLVPLKQPWPMLTHSQNYNTLADIRFMKMAS